MSPFFGLEKAMFTQDFAVEFWQAGGLSSQLILFERLAVGRKIQKTQAAAVQIPKLANRGRLCSAYLVGMGKFRGPCGSSMKSTLRLTADAAKDLSALSGVAYTKLGAIFPSLVAPKPAPTPMTSERVAI